MGTENGRLDAVCCAIQCYRIIALMASRLPPLERRLILWQNQVRGLADVTLTPRGAVKVISQFKLFAKVIGTSKAVLTKAYEVANAAAAQQMRLGQLPFLVAALEGPDFGRSGFSVCTTPLGYSRSINTEQVGHTQHGPPSDVTSL